jgi:excisionase family DNA binding protein
MKEEKFLTKAEVCARFGIAERTLNGWMKRRLIPFRKIGHVVRFVESEVEERINKDCRIGLRARRAA